MRHILIVLCLLIGGSTIAQDANKKKKSETPKTFTLKVDMDESRLLPGKKFRDIMTITAVDVDGKAVKSFSVTIHDIGEKVTYFDDPNKPDNPPKTIATDSGKVVLSLDTTQISAETTQARFSMQIQGSAVGMIAKPQRLIYLITNQAVSRQTAVVQQGGKIAKGSITFKNDFQTFFPDLPYEIVAVVKNAKGEAVKKKDMAIKFEGDATFDNGTTSAIASTDDKGELKIQFKIKPEDKISKKKNFTLKVQQMGTDLVKGEFKHKVTAYELQLSYGYQLREIMAGREYRDEYRVTVSDHDGAPVNGATVTMQVISGPVALNHPSAPSDGSFSYFNNAKATTDANGLAVFSIKARPLIKEDAKSEEFKLKIDAENGEGAKAASKEHKGKVRQSVDDPKKSPRVFGEIFLGNSFAREFDDMGESSGFGETNPMFVLRTETLWGKDKNWSFRLGADIQYAGFLNEEPMETMTTNPPPDQDPETKMEENAAQTVALKTIDAIAGKLHFQWEPGWAQSYSRSKDVINPYDAYRFGLVGGAGFINREKEKPSNQDTEIGYWELGLTMRHYRTTAPNAKDDNYNRAPSKFIRAVYAKYEEWPLGIANSTDPMSIMDAEDYEHRLVVDAGLRLFHFDEKKEVPFYAAIHGNVGEGPDDIRLIVGTLFNVNELSKIIK